MCNTIKPVLINVLMPTYLPLQLLEALDDDPSAKKLHLAHKFEQVAATIDGSPLY